MSEFWFVDGVGLRRGSRCENAYPITQTQYSYWKEHYELLNITIVDGVPVAHTDIVAYRKAALSRVQNVNFIIVDNRKYFDDELPYMSGDYFLRSGGPCRITQAQMIKLVTERNRQFTMRLSGIQTAKTPEEIDGYLTCQTT